MTCESSVLDRGAIAKALRDALRSLPGIEDAYFMTTDGVVARTAAEDTIGIDVTMDCRMPPNRIEIIDDALVVIDRNGSGCTLAEMTTRTAVQRQLRKWQADFTFDYDVAQSAINDFFAAQPQAKPEIDTGEVL